MYLITGATGHGGGPVARQLHEQGHSVRALVRDPSRAAGLPACHAPANAGPGRQAHDEKDGPRLMALLAACFALAVSCGARTTAVTSFAPGHVTPPRRGDKAITVGS